MIRTLCLAAVLIGCTSTPTVPPAADRTNEPAGRVSPGGASLPPITPRDFTPAGSTNRVVVCGMAVYSGLVPDALDFATGRNVPRGHRYVVTRPATAAGFLFDDPLQAGKPQKVLWVVGAPRVGPLIIEARHHDGGPSSQVARLESGALPGEIYPSSFQLPRAGCWELTLRWGSFEAKVDLEFTAAAR